VGAPGPRGPRRAVFARWGGGPDFGTWDWRSVGPNSSCQRPRSLSPANHSRKTTRPAYMFKLPLHVDAQNATLVVTACNFRGLKRPAACAVNLQTESVPSYLPCLQQLATPAPETRKHPQSKTPHLLRHYVPGFADNFPLPAHNKERVGQNPPPAPIPEP